jgi:DNA-binding response OmpR family regulator
VAQGSACLLQVEVGAPPPLEWGYLEDWLREPIDYDELDARRARLRRRLVERQPVWMDDDGLLHRGAAWVAVAPLEVRFLAPMLARKDQVVSRDALCATVYGDSTPGDPRLVDATVHRLRRRVRPLGVTIHTVRAIGFLLEVGALPD